MATATLSTPPACSELFSAITKAKLSIRSCTDRGRFVVALSAYNPGDLIFAQRPYVCALEASKVTMCYKCLAHLAKPLRCSKCKTARYCAQKCQLDDWSTHKTECLWMQQLSEKQDKTLAILCIRLLNKMHSEEHPSYKSDANASDRALEVMSMCKPSIGAGTTMETEAKIYAANLLQLLPDGIPKDINRTVDIINRSVRNSFSVSDRFEDHMGRAIYPSASLFNHSCKPNAWAYFDERNMEIQIRALSPIQSDQEVCIAYTSEIPHAVIRRRLAQDWGFSCLCDYCATTCSTSLEISSLSNFPTTDKSSSEFRSPTSATSIVLDAETYQQIQTLPAPRTLASQDVKKVAEHLARKLSKSKDSTCFPVEAQQTIELLRALEWLYRTNDLFSEAALCTKELLEILDQLQVPSMLPLVYMAQIQGSISLLSMLEWESAAELIREAIKNLRLAGSLLLPEFALLYQLANNPCNFVQYTTQWTALPLRTPAVDELFVNLSEQLTNPKFGII